MLFTVIFLGLLALETSADDPHYSPASCQVTDIKVGQDGNALYGIVKFPDMRENFDSTKCNTVVNIQTTSNSHLFIRFSKLRVSCGRNASVSIKGNSSNIIAPYCGWYTNWPAIISYAEYLSVIYYHGNSRPSEDEKIEFSFTSYYEGRCNGGNGNSRSHDSSDEEDDDEDKDDEFQCRNNRCIDRSAACNGYDSCGDWSDESSSTCGLTTGAIVAIAVTCSTIGLLLIICIAAACSGMKKKKNKRQPGQSTSISPAQVTPEMELDHPITFTMYAPPPYTQTNPTDAGFAAPYGGELGFDKTEPPKYDEISLASVRNR